MKLDIKEAVNPFISAFKHAFLCPHMEIKVVYFTSVIHKTVLNPNISFIDVRQPKPELWAKGRKIAI